MQRDTIEKKKLKGENTRLHAEVAAEQIRRWRDTGRSFGGESGGVRSGSAGRGSERGDGFEVRRDESPPHGLVAVVEEP